MKKTHVIRSTPLLVLTAAALSSMTGCAPTTAPVTSATPVATEVAPSPVATTTTPTPVDAPVVATASTPPEQPVAPASHVTTAELVPEPFDDGKAPTNLIALREELFQSDHGPSAFARLSHFRPLCDAQGYPVVGNVYRKASGYQTSTFCSELRARDGRK